MMDIYINSKKISVDNNNFLQNILIEQEYSNGYFAVAINRTFIPRNQYAHTLIHDGDQIDIVTPMQGG